MACRITMEPMIENNWQAHHSNHTVIFDGDKITTTVTNDPQVVNHWISVTEGLRRANSLQVVGLDVEWRPNRYRNQDNPPAVVQICVANRCLVYQILNSPYVPTQFVRFLDNPNYTFVGVDVKSDLEKLQWKFNGLGSQAIYVDLRSLAATVGHCPSLRRRGLAYLAEYFLGKTMYKSLETQTSEWDEEFLEEDQIIYACLDAYVSYLIGKELNASLYRGIC